MDSSPTPAVVPMASKFIADGMSFKKLHKDILMSRTYQLSAAPVASLPSNVSFVR